VASFSGYPGSVTIGQYSIALIKQNKSIALIKQNKTHTLLWEKRNTRLFVPARSVQVHGWLVGVDMLSLVSCHVTCARSGMHTEQALIKASLRTYALCKLVHSSIFRVFVGVHVPAEPDVMMQRTHNSNRRDCVYSLCWY